MFRSICLAAALMFSLTTLEAMAVESKDPENTIVIELSSGEVVIEMLPDVAPLHVERIKTLVLAGEYDNVAFHRVIEGFMAQTGDVQFGDMENGYDARRTGTGGSNLPDVQAEFSSVPFDRGVARMSRSQSPNSANSQFFIMFEQNHGLTNNYTVWGRVIEGMDAVDQIKKAPAGSQSGSVDNPDKMLRVRVKADIN